MQRGSEMGFYTNKKVLITGGTGTIGQYLVKRILQDEPAVVRVFSRDEYKQFEMQQELSGYKNVRYLIGDVRDYERLVRAMEDIDYVFHLAAMKHVPACEYNPFEAVQTNVIGTQNVIQAAINAKVKRVLFTSSDKAVSPTNTYGSTKLMGERLISAAEYQKGPKSTVFASVRFGNVMGSRGSVIPLFKNQILKDQRITVTNKEMLRYMMTPAQAIELLLKANELAYGGEVFVLKMPVIELQDLADVMIEEISQKYGVANPVEVVEIGLRPGEKMFEELMSEDEAHKALEMEDMFVLQPDFGAGQSRDYPGTSNQLDTVPSPFAAEVVEQEVLRKWLLDERLI